MLAEIVAATRRRLPELTDRSESLMAAASRLPPPPSFRRALEAPGMSVIAEVKRRSPSRGDLAPDLDPSAQALRYAAGGAAAVSVLTEPEYFSGSPDDLAAVAGAVDIPVLRKDFIVHPAQVWEARALGASAVLLIVAVLDRDELASLLAVCSEAGLDPLVEVHDAAEARIAVDVGAPMVGVNNRDLTDFSVDLATAEAVAPLLAEIPVTIAESGIFTGADAARMGAAGYDAVLVGEALVKAPDPAALVAELRAAG
jgi:indole-3-glycerol phosphate synthase